MRGSINEKSTERLRSHRSARPRTSSAALKRRNCVGKRCRTEPHKRCAPATFREWYRKVRCCESGQTMGSGQSEMGPAFQLTERSRQMALPGREHKQADKPQK